MVDRGTGGWPRHLAATLVGLLAGAMLGEPFSESHPAAAFLAIPLAALLALLAARLAPKQSRAAVALLVLFAFALRGAAGVLLHGWALASGRDGFITGDDAAYAILASAFAQYVGGDPQPPLVPPYWAGNAYLFGTWVYLESALFFLLDHDVRLALVMNAFFGALAILLLYDLARRLFGERTALRTAIVLAVWPSLVAWSALNLKDALALLLIAVVLWSIRLFQERPALLPVIAALAATLLLESVRRYLFVGLALVGPLSALLAARRRPAGLRWAAAWSAGATLLLAGSQSGMTLGPGMLATFEATRAAMSVGARTAFTEAPPLLVRRGETFIVVAPSRSIGSPGPAQVADFLAAPSATAPALATAAPTAAASALPRAQPTAAAPTAAPTARATAVPASALPRAQPTAVPTAAPTAAAVRASPVPRVQPSATAPALATAAPTAAASALPRAQPTAVASAPPVGASPLPRAQPTAVAPAVVHLSEGAKLVVTTAADPTPVPGVTYVRPGDVVVVGSADTTPAPAAEHKLLAPSERGPTRFVTVGPDQDAAVLRRTLAHLPVGLAHAIFAPFPWSARRALDVLAILETVAWALVLAAAAVEIWRRRESWRTFAPFVLFAAGLLLLLSLAEGNVGTLFRHRGMVIPIVIVLAGPAWAALAMARDRRQARSSIPSEVADEGATRRTAEVAFVR